MGNGLPSLLVDRYPTLLIHCVLPRLITHYYGVLHFVIVICNYGCYGLLKNNYAMPRLFSGSQRVTLYRIADGRCQKCNKELNHNFHADHIIPYSKGGPTTIKNGQALCPECNISKSNTMPNKTLVPRKWQEDALAKFKQLGAPQLFVIGAVPGAGKSKAAALIANDRFEEGAVNTIIALCPQGAKKADWQADFFDFFGIALDASYCSNRTFRHGPKGHSYQGAVLTYQGLSQDNIVGDLQRICSHPNHNVLVIADEVHHLGTGENSKWGKAFDRAFRDAKNVIYLSGTYWRTDKQPIPRLKIDPVTGAYATDISYTLTESLQDGNSRKPEFDMQDPIVTYDDGEGDVFEGHFSEMEEAKINRCYSQLVKKHDVHTMHLLQSALTKLEEVRTVGKWKMPDAGMIIFAPDQEAAYELKDWLYTEDFGYIVSTVVVSDEDAANADLEAFKKGTDRVLICVNMVSEGVDVPRLRVGVFLSRYKSRLFFVQSIVGRIIRVLQKEYLDYNNGIMARCNSSYAYLFKHPSFVEYATDLEAEVAIAEAYEKIRDLDANAKDDNERAGGASLFIDSPTVEIRSVGTTDRVIDGNRLNGDQVSQIERFFAGVQEELSPKTRSTITANLMTMVKPVPVAHAPAIEIHPQEAEKRAAADLNAIKKKIVSLLVVKASCEYSDVISRLSFHINRTVGVNSLDRKHAHVTAELLNKAIENARQLRQDLVAYTPEQCALFVQDLEYKKTKQWNN